MSEHSALKWIMKKSKNQTLKMVFLILANVILSLLTVFFAFAIKKVIEGAEHSDISSVTIGAIYLISIVLLQFVFRIIVSSLSENIRYRLDILFKTDIFNHLLHKRISSTQKYHSGELMNRLNSDVSVVTDGVTSIVPSIVGAVTRLVSAVVALIMLDWVFAVAFSVAGLLVFSVVGLLRGKLKSLHKKVQESDGKTRSFMQESLENLLAIKVFSVNDKIEKESNNLQEKNYKIRMKRNVYAVLGHATHNLIFSAGYLFALIYGAFKMLYGVMTYGALSAVLQLVNNVQVPFMSLSSVFPKYYAMLSSAERLIELENLEDEPKEVLFNGEELYSKTEKIVFDGISFSYGRDQVLIDSSLVLNKGDFVAITGISGIGKSTLIKLMLGVYPPDKGEIYLQTQDGKVELNNSTRCMFSYVPQGNMLFSGTIKDNVTFASGDKTEEEIENALKLSCAQEFVAQLPEGLDTVVGEKGVGLSEGQIQRIAIARAILCKSPIMLFDEATSALDEETEQKLLEGLKKLNNVTLIIISHKPSALEICNKHVEIANKKLMLI